MNILLFAVAGRRCALPLTDVREVLRAAAVSPLPSAPPAVAGVIDVRGAVLPVFSLRVRFGLPEREVDPADRLVVARAGDRPVVLLVDDVVGVVRLEEGDLVRVDDMAAAPGYVRGVARLADGLVLIHDLRRFLSPAESAAMDAALSATPALPAVAA